MNDTTPAANGFSNSRFPLALAALTLLSHFLGNASARAGDDPGEFVISAFTGIAVTENNDLRLKQNGGTDLTFHGASYHGRDFENPPFYGGRILYFLPNKSPWGFGVEYFHSKMYLDTGKSVQVTGTRAGVPVNDIEPISDSINHFSISHGLNFITADAFYRWSLGHRGEDFLGRFQPYLGAGVGVVIPHVETQIVGGPFEEDYQFHGPSVLAMAGLNFDITKHLSLFTEYKFSYAHLGAMQVPNGAISVDPMTHNFISGISFRF
jgi:lipid A oxidase